MRKQSEAAVQKPLRLLIVEDDAALASSIGEWFTLDGHRCDYAADGQAALLLLSKTSFDVMLLDVNLPGIDGLEVARRVRQIGNTIPILMLTARDEIVDRVEGLDAGADDYVVKPFALAEVAARVRVLSRRRTGDVQILSIGPLDLLIDERRVRRSGLDICLSPISWRLLETLARSSPAPVDRESLCFAVWGEEQPRRDNLKVQMFKLRSAIDKPFNVPLIKTIRGGGYCLYEDNRSNA